MSGASDDELMDPEIERGSEVDDYTCEMPVVGAAPSSRHPLCPDRARLPSHITPQISAGEWCVDA